MTESDPYGDFLMMTGQKTYITYINGVREERLTYEYSRPEPPLGTWADEESEERGAVMLGRVMLVICIFVFWVIVAVGIRVFTIPHETNPHAEDCQENHR